MAEEVFTNNIYSKYISRIFFWKSAPNIFQEEVRMIVKTSMHTPDIIITNGTDMKVNLFKLFMIIYFIFTLFKFFLPFPFSPFQDKSVNIGLPFQKIYFELYEKIQMITFCGHVENYPEIEVGNDICFRSV